MKPPHSENEPFFSPEVLLVGEMHWHILRAARLMYEKSIEIIKESGTNASKLVPMLHRNVVPMLHRNAVLPASLRQRSTDFGREVGRDEINWWVFKKEREIEEFRSETIKALRAAQSLKKSSEALKSKRYESYADLLQMLTQFAKDHDTDIKALHQFVLWLAARDVLAPVILFTDRVWGSTRMGNREVKVDTNEPKASQDTIKSIAEVVFGLTNFLGTPVCTKAKDELNVEMWKRAYEDERANVIPEGQIVQRASAMAFEECAEYFELIRDSLRNIQGAATRKRVLRWLGKAFCYVVLI